MLRAFCLSVLGLAWLAETCSAQTTPAPKDSPHKTTTARRAPTPPRTVSNATPAARRANPLRGTNDNGAGQSGYAAPGEPIQTPGTGGKDTAT